MVDPFLLAAFVPAALALNLTPGADMMFCVGQGLRRGPAAAWAASAGISLGGMIHVLLAGLGLGALIAAVPWSFEVIRWIGVIYLLYLAYQMLRSRGQDADLPAIGSARRAFVNGMLVNLTNPKVILFVLAFVPQFVTPGTPAEVLAQFLLFGAVIGVGGFVVNGMAGVLAARAGRRMTGGGAALRWISSTIFLGLALRLAVMERT